MPVHNGDFIIQKPKVGNTTLQKKKLETEKKLEKMFSIFTSILTAVQLSMTQVTPPCKRPHKLLRHNLDICLWAGRKLILLGSNRSP